MALINKKHVTERETVSYKLDRTTIEMVRLYAEFIGSPQEHVVNESLLFIFRKDRDFIEWLTTNGKRVPPPPKEGAGNGEQSALRNKA